METENAIKRTRKCPNCGSQNLREANWGDYEKYCLECDFSINKYYIQDRAEMGKALAIRHSNISTTLASADGDEWDEAREAYFSEKEKVEKKIKALEAELKRQTKMQMKLRSLGSQWEGQLRG